MIDIFLYGAHKSKLLVFKPKLLTINDLPRIVLSYLTIFVGNLVGGIWLQLIKQTTTSNVIGWLIFLLAHRPSNLPSFLIYGWMSAVLTWTAYRTRRLEMSISVQMLLNSISFILLALFTIFMKNFGI